ncbi:hypothetical protein JAAARDRAFT_44074 [Jaapia argillacea MUCL 33604]|uniref:Uncharacterized protein n=1 Tax=Jaapia argillacea MUCL 33604 TaxID=933084 RepID=A0A067QK82_9AGAM|nr:hypothetical protein JAAARDRAFT_44074 [Jaapia argillacea MUCL 33604]
MGDGVERRRERCRNVGEMSEEENSVEPVETSPNVAGNTALVLPIPPPSKTAITGNCKTAELSHDDESRNGRGAGGDGSTQERGQTRCEERRFKQQEAVLEGEATHTVLKENVRLTCLELIQASAPVSAIVASVCNVIQSLGSIVRVWSS